jgi:hypothetical protein
VQLSRLQGSSGQSWRSEAGLVHANTRGPTPRLPGPAKPSHPGCANALGACRRPQSDRTGVSRPGNRTGWELICQVTSTWWWAPAHRWRCAVSSARSPLAPPSGGIRSQRPAWRRPGKPVTLGYARDGDVIVVHTLDRLGRTLCDTLKHPQLFSASGSPTDTALNHPGRAPDHVGWPTRRSTNANPDGRAGPRSHPARQRRHHRETLHRCSATRSATAPTHSPAQPIPSPDK